MFLSGTLNIVTSHHGVVCNIFLQGNVDQGLFFGEAPLYDINTTAGEAQYARLAPQIKKDNTARERARRYRERKKKEFCAAKEEIKKLHRERAALCDIVGSRERELQGLY